MSDNLFDLVPPQWGIRKLSDREYVYCGSDFMFHVSEYWNRVAPRSLNWSRAYRAYHRSTLAQGKTTIPITRDNLYVQANRELICYLADHLAYGIAEPFTKVLVTEIAGSLVQVKPATDHTHNPFHDLWLDANSPVIVGNAWEFKFLRENRRFHSFWINLRPYEGIDPKQFLRDLRSIPADVDLIPPEWGLRQLSEREIRRCGERFIQSLHWYWHDRRPGRKIWDTVDMLWRNAPRWDYRPDVPQLRSGAKYFNELVTYALYLPNYSELGLSAPFMWAKAEAFGGDLMCMRLTDGTRVSVGVRTPQLVTRYEYLFLRNHPRLREFWIGLSPDSGVQPDQYLADFVNFPLEL